MDKLLRDVLELRARKGIDERGRLLLEGLRLVRAAHAAGVPFEHVLYTPEYFSDDACRELLVRVRAAGIATHQLAPREFSRLSYKAEGLVGVVRHAAPPLEVALRAPRVVVLDALSDPGNIGSILRTANAWDAAVIAIDGPRKLYHPKALSLRGRRWARCSTRRPRSPIAMP
jgi:RNA methyltransferase, TrmH family